MPDTELRIRPAERDAIIQSLRAGVVPRRGLRHIQVGRKREVESLIADIDRVADGGAAVRFVIGRYGAGKTFFLHLVRTIALERRLVTAHADLSPDRRLHATGGQARALFAELMGNVATRSKPDGGAMGSIVERFISSALQEARDADITPSAVIRRRLDALVELPGGYDFAEVIDAYWRAYDTGDEALKTAVVRWLRGEFDTRTEARKAVGVRTIVDDGNAYERLKLFARFVRLAGYSGLLICLDEMVNLYKLSSSQARRSNYEQILRIVNDGLQGTEVGMGVLMGGTPEFLTDTRRGLYSYEALQSRLAENTFARDGLVDLSGPVLRLENLSPEDLFVLLSRVADVYRSRNGTELPVDKIGIQAFMRHCSDRVGATYYQTPRASVTAFVNLLAVLEQNPEVKWEDLLGSIDIGEDVDPFAGTGEIDDDPSDELATFTL